MPRDSKADTFTNFFDGGWKNNKSTIRSKFQESRVYDPSYSWDAKADDPKSFTRLNQTLVPYQPTKPIVLSGTAVVQLENTEGFNAINVKQPAAQLSSIPLSSKQIDLGMSHDLSCKVPIQEEARRQNGTVIMEDPITFKNQHLDAPTLKVSSVPRFIEEAGPNADQRLLNPQQRREFNAFEKRQNEAQRFIKAAQSERQKTKTQMCGLQFHRGVLMVDSSDNPSSEIYGDRAVQQQVKEQYKSQIHLERKANLAKKTSSIITNGNFLNPDSMGPRVQISKHYQSKGGDYHGFSFDETYNRIFCRLQGVSNGPRTQRLRDLDTSGKPYNITQHTTIEHWPPKNYQREYNKVLDHPSQNTLEGQRNLQGTIRKY